MKNIGKTTLFCFCFFYFIFSCHLSIGKSSFKSRKKQNHLSQKLSIYKELGNDSLITKIMLNYFPDINDSYYVFLVNVRSGTNTNAHVIYTAYKRIKENSPCNSVYFVLNDEGISEKNISLFFGDVLKISFDDIIKKNTRINDSLYVAMGGEGPLSKLLYVKNNRLYFSEILKYSDPDKLLFPCDFLEVTFKEKVKLDQTTTLHTKLNMFYYVNSNYLLQIADATNRVGLLNVNTGKLDFIMNKTKLNAIDLYKEYVSKDPKKIKYANDHAGWVNEYNRFDVPIYTASVQKNNIYIYFGIQVLERVEKNEVLKFSTNDSMVIKVGEPIANNYAFIATLDSHLNIQKINYIYDIDRKLQPGVNPTFEFFLFKDDTVLTCNEFEDTSGFNQTIYSKFRNKGVVVMKLDALKKNIIYAGMKPVPSVDDYLEKGNFFLSGVLFEFFDESFVHYHSSPKIYNLNSGKVVTSLSGTEDTEEKKWLNTFPVGYDSLHTHFNWEYFSSNEINNGKYYGFIFGNGGKKYLEIFGKDFNKLQLIPIDSFLPNGTVKIIMGEDGFFVFVYENHDYYLYKFTLSISDQSY
ncbi:MAG: hypothetical protein A3H98_06410 [Bacteroidetes bacterium RIFCSPLOWO2_02_FULL_36_8]|nr:MAG: hypothetical protein A3H98_06410 [Bacteroidetes bacterium RIFCSPLOWO2_02_FULL_36_8]OFY69008.1 MAG: hypothetical protein A3G23_13070 [Bacteroidetes bacterium RIFCSPLOWO2_12_FULL_37_12]